MKSFSFHSSSPLSAFLFSGVCPLIMVLGVAPFALADSPVPWECTEYEGEAQNRCIRMFAELQQQQIDRLEKELEAQKHIVDELKDQVNKQAATTNELEEELDRTRYRTEGPPWTRVYPPWGFSLRFGRDGWYGGTYYYGPPYYGPRYYYPRHRRWHRHW